MAVSKTKKIDILENLKKSIKDAKSIAFTTNNWLSVEEITNLRKDLRTVNWSFTLVKKTLIKIAFTVLITWDDIFVRFNFLESWTIPPILLT